MRTRIPREALGAILLVAVHFAVAWGDGRDSSVLRNAVYWLPTGIAVAGACLLGWRAALYVTLSTILYRLWLGRAPFVAVVPAVGNGLETLAAWALLQRFGFQPTLRRFRDALALIVTAILAPLVSATVAVITFAIAGHPSDVLNAEFWAWWRMNALGIIVIAPTILSWISSPLPRFTRWTALEVGAGVLILALFVRLMFVSTDSGVGLLLSYLSVGVGLYAAVRFGTRAATAVGTIIALIAVSGPVVFRGPFLLAGLGVREMALQAFILILCLAPLLLAAIMGDRKEALVSRQRSDSALRAVQEILPDFTFRLNRQGVYLDVYIPPGGALSRSPEQIVGRTLEEVVPEHAVALRETLNRALAGHPAEPAEYPVRIGGRRRIREVRMVLLAEGEVLCLVRDITERKLAEELLSWQARMLELVATGHPTPEVLERIVTGIESQIDGSACSLLFLEGRRLHVALAHSLPASYNAAIEGVEIGPDVGSCGTAAYYNRTVVVSDIAHDPLWARYVDLALPHGLRACWSVPLRSAGGAVLGTFAVYHREVRAPQPSELTLVERAASLAAIAVERARREDLLDSINRNVAEGLFRSTPDRGLVYVNEAFARMFGYDSPDEMLQVPSAALYANPARREELKRLVNLKGSIQQEEVEFLRKDGSTFTGMLSSAEVVDTHGQQQHYYDGAVWDITDRKRLEEQLRQAQKMEAVGKLAGGVAHDFNNLLTAIAGYADSLVASLPEEGTARQDAMEITRAASRAASLTRQLLAYSRQQILTPKVLHLREVVDQLGGMLRRLIGEDIRFTTRHQDPDATVTVDRGQIEQVLLNLVLNARDAMPQGGTLTISTSVQQLDEARARAYGLEAGPHVCLQVQDSGTGMDEATRSRAFDPFFTTKEPGKGTGLGLSTVYGIVQQSGGSVRLESTPGAGTVVRVYLPKVGGMPEAEPEADTRPAVPVPGLTTLVVEDEQLVRDLVCRTLRRAGYYVLVAASGEEALALSRATPEPIELLVTDVVMPRMNGSELATRLAAERPGIRVLFISGYATEVLDVRGGLEPGTEYLQKPFTPSALLDRVRELLTPARARV